MTHKIALAKIHIAKKQLGMDDDTYRAMLRVHGGVESAKNLSPVGAAKVLAHLERCGFKPISAPKGARPVSAPSRAAQVRKIEAQLTDAGRPWTYADALAKRICNIERIDWCEPEHLSKIIAALSYDAKRRIADAVKQKGEVK